MSVSSALAAGPLAFLRLNARPLGFGLLHAFFSSPGQTIVIGLFIASFMATFRLTAGEIGALYLAANLASGVTLIAIGHLIDSMELRRFSSVVIVGLAVACLLTAIAPHPLVLFLGLYALRLTGQGLMVHIEATATARAFDENRGRALGITGLGLPLSDATMPSVALVAMALLGWRGTYAAIAIFLLAVVLPLARLLAGGTRPPTIVLAPVPIRLRLATAFRLMACRRYVWLVLPAVAVMPFLLTGLLFNASAIAAARSWSREAMAATFPAMSAISIAALILSGRLVDRFSGRRVFALHVLPLIAGLLVLAWFPADWAVPAGLMLIGVSGGVAKTSGTAIWAELFGTAHLGAIRSFVAMFTVFSTAAAPFAFGLLVDAGWSWPAILAVSAAGAALFAAPLMVAELIRPSDAG